MRLDNYLNAYYSYFWQWEDNATVLGIIGGSTIAYSQYVEEVVDLLRTQGLPPFGSLLMALVATNSDGKSDLISLQRQLENSHPDMAGDGLFDEAFSFLNTLQAMSPSFKTGSKRIMLLQAAFQDVHNSLSPYKTAQLWEKCYRPKALMEKESISDVIVKREFSALAIQGRRITSASELEARILGLPEVEEGELEFLLPQRKEPLKGQEYIDELLEDSRTFQTAALVQGVWSGLDIPFQQTVSSEQPMGGVSDLTNKGQYDKLLISEFANDDITLLSRLANNEALYLNREVPPADNKFERIILVDASLKSWGKPKVIAHAVMMAIAKHPKSNFGYSCFMLGAGYQSLGIETIEEVVDGLSSLDACMDVSEGFDLFFDQHSISVNQQVIYIGANEAMKSIAFQRAFNEHRHHIQFRISTYPDGRVSLHKNTSKSLKHVHDFILPLEKLWSQERPKRKETNKENALEIGVLLPQPPKCRDTLFTENGFVFKITNNGHILKSYSQKAKLGDLGWEEIGAGILPPKGHYEVGVNSKEEWILLVYQEATHEIRIINLNTREEKQCFFPHWRHHTLWSSTWHEKSFFFFNGAFHHQNEAGKWRITLDGTIEKSSDELVSEVENRLSFAREKILRTYTHPVLKNIRRVFINSDAELCFDSHVLKVNPNQNLSIRNAHDPKPQIQSDGISEHDFVFPDSSQVITSKQGYIILRSADKALPTIYMPSVLGKTLGLAAGNHFTGNNYYLKYRQFKVILDNRGGKSLNVVKTIKAQTGYGLKEAKMKTDFGGDLGTYSLFDATQFVNHLESAGATVRMEEETAHPGAADFVRIGGFQFFDTYIQAFVKHILDHGA